MPGLWAGFVICRPCRRPGIFRYLLCLYSQRAAFAVWLEVAYSPPFWVHLVTSLPIILLTCIPPLRHLKGWLIASQYFHKAEEGRLVFDE